LAKSELSFGLGINEEMARPVLESCVGTIYVHKHQAITAEITEENEESLNRRRQRKRREIRNWALNVI